MEICSGIGVEQEHIRVINPLRKYHDENRMIIEEELNHRGVSVIIAQRECIQIPKRTETD